MIPVGSVIATMPGKASVHLIRSTACAHCQACSLGTSADRSLTVLALDPIGVHEGQRVELVMPRVRSFHVALMVYTLPLCTLFGSFALLERHLTGSIVPALGSLLNCFGSFFLLRLWERKRSDDPAFLPSIRSIVEESSVILPE